jgi:hypothetical protein
MVLKWTTASISGITTRAALSLGYFLCFGGKPRFKYLGSGLRARMLIKGRTKRGHEKKVKYGQM